MMSSQASRPIRRRAALGLLGATPLMAVAPAAAAAARPSAAPVPPSRFEGVATDVSELLAPLAPGAEIGGYRIETLVPFAEGAAAVVLRDRAGTAFQVDICARDESPGAPVPPARTVHFDLFLANGGGGATASFERHGLGAMMLAEIVKHNESRLDLAGYATLRERLRSAPTAVVRHV